MIAHGPVARSPSELDKSTTLIAGAVPLSPRPPQWVDEALGDAVRERLGSLDVVASRTLALISTTVADARAMNGEALRASVAGGYEAIHHAADALGCVPIRFWNFLPGVGEAMGGGLDRYMVFNAGRFDAYERKLGTPRFAAALPAASAVGTEGEHLTITCLASERGGRPLENPRQTPAWRYSRRYGPLPPCFSRATVAHVNGRTLLLVAGTASVVGEDSTHAGDAEAQLDETLRNLAAVVAEATGDAPEGELLERLGELRVYITRESDVPMIEHALRARCAGARRIELTVARVCRPELLVEIEGMAEIEKFTIRNSEL